VEKRVLEKGDKMFENYHYLLSLLLPLVLMFPVSVKWEISKSRSIPWLIAMGGASCASLYLISKILPAAQPFWALGAAFSLSVIITVSFMIYSFHRDPERTPPGGQGSMVSPADGKVIYIKTVHDGKFPFAMKNGKVIELTDFIKEHGFMDKGVQIGIAMNFLNIHVNRTPLSGTVRTIRRIPGKFHSLKHLSSLLENERVCTLIEGEKITVGVVQIASRLVRRITSYFREGDPCRIGDRMGMIRFGSQVDILIPQTEGLEVLVEVGDEIKAGETLVARYDPKA
jgi:phosphatidylserine decarboxylase